MAPIVTSSPESTSKSPVVRIAEPTVTSSSAVIVADTTLKAPVVTLSPATNTVSMALTSPVTSILLPASTFKLPTPVAILSKFTVAKVTFRVASIST